VAVELVGLPPVMGRTTRVMVFGSFPGVASLAAARYYAHPQNQLWPILGAILAEDLMVLPYAKRLAALKARGVGLWDAYAACVRQGSLDRAIRQAVPNDYASLKRRAPALRRICLNGGFAARAAKPLEALGYEVRVLPSTSPAHATRSLAQKRVLWRAAFEGALE
jgi:hypoxanthine-DNA glycosylase